VRRSVVWEPYHAALEIELARLKSEFGYALLWDAHSIRSQVPRFFNGKLPDFNLGTAAGDSCPANLANDLMKTLSSHGRYQSILDGRFKGGFITRNYGSPLTGTVAVQLELSQVTYMNEDSFAYDKKLAAGVIKIIEMLIAQFMAYQPPLSLN
jgi:N-formylglutamate deformylase